MRSPRGTTTFPFRSAVTDSRGRRCGPPQGEDIGLGYRRWLGLGAVIAGGPLLIGIFMAVFSARPRRLTQSEQKAIDRATHENRGEEQVH